MAEKSAQTEKTLQTAKRDTWKLKLAQPIFVDEHVVDWPHACAPPNYTTRG